jgi:hypothetical protein
MDDVSATISHENEIIASGIITGGSITLPISAITVGELLKVTVHGYNVIPYQGDVLITTNEPLVILQEYSVTGEQALTYNQSQYIDLTLQNIGLNNAGNVTASLTSTDPVITNISGNINVNFGSISGSGGTSSSSGNFNVTINDQVANMINVAFDLEITDGNQTWNYDLLIPVKAPDLGFQSSNIFDPSDPPAFISNPLTYIQQGAYYYYEAEVLQQKGNGDANIDPGETLTISVAVQNGGDATIENVPVELSTGSTWVNIPNPQVVIDFIEPGNAGMASFDVDVDELCPLGYQLALEVDADAGFYTTSQINNFIVGRVDETFETEDFQTLDWSFIGESWLITDLGFGGTKGTTSPPIDNSENTELMVTLNALVADSVSFRFKVSSEEGCDKFVFKIDEEEICVYSGEIDWQFIAFPLSEGTHTLTWRYQKDFIFSSGDDRVYLDDISLPPFENTKTNIRITGNQLPGWLTIDDQHNGSAILTGIAPGTTGIETVEIMATQNDESNSQQFNIEIGTVNIKTNDMEQVEVSPNPFSESVMINTGGNKSFTLVINDLQGKMIYLHTFPEGQSIVNLKSIPRGTYLFKIISNGKTTKRTIIKN